MAESSDVLERVHVARSGVAHFARTLAPFTLCGRIAGRVWWGRSTSTCGRCVVEAGLANLNIPKGDAL